MTYKQALELDQNWTAEQAKNDLERFLLRGEPPAFKAVALAMQALEKQIPEKPGLHTIFPNGVICYRCPKCNYKYIVRSDKLCYGCGQALDWSDENENEM